MPTENTSNKTSIAVTITAVATLITALGGLVYALKSKNLSAEEKKEKVITWFGSDTGDTEKILYGNVGKLETTFNLSIDEKSGAVKGTYFYNKRQDQLYQLSGVSSKNNLHLTEFTKGKPTAKCVLKKGDNGCYTGKMFNDDGRNYTMNICE